MDKVGLISLIVSFAFMGLFFLSLSIIYKANEKKRLRIFNTFIFECVGENKNLYVFLILLFAVIVTIFPFFFYSFAASKVF